MFSNKVTPLFNDVLTFYGAPRGEASYLSGEKSAERNPPTYVGRSRLRSAKAEAPCLVPPSGTSQGLPSLLTTKVTMIKGEGG